MLAAFLSSDDNFSIVRRFGFLHHRVLLYKQAELAELERQLDSLDLEDNNEKDRWRNRVALPDGLRNIGAKQELLRDIEQKLEEYGTFA